MKCHCMGGGLRLTRHLCFDLGKDLGAFGADLFSGDGVQVANNLAHNILVAGFFKVRQDDLFGIGFSLIAGFPQLLGRPKAQLLIGASSALKIISSS